MTASSLGDPPVARRPSVLYLAYWGALEPLGQALVVPTVDELSRAGARVALITFEKIHDWKLPGAADGLARHFGDQHVDWIPLRYHKRPRVPATLFDVAQGWARGVVVGRRARAQLIHARTFIGGLIGSAVAATLRVPFVYHAEGFYPDEMVDGGFWRRDSLAHWAAKHLDLGLFRSAHGIVVLSESAREALAADGLADSPHRPVAVVPSAIDVERFRVRAGGPLVAGELRLVHLGSVGGRYRLEAAARFTRIALDYRPARLEVLSAAPTTARDILVGTGLPREYWSVRSVAPVDVPDQLGRFQAGFALLVEGLSNHSGSPTKVGEYWASGLPVITTANVGDVGRIAERERVGVLLRGDSDTAYADAVRELLDLLQDPSTPARCRRVAEAHYSVPAAVDRQLRLYQRIIEKSARPQTTE